MIRAVSRSSITTVAQYLAAQPAATRALLAKVRAAIRAAVPTATESIAYQMPAYRLEGEVLIYFAGWREHYSLYPAYPSTVAPFAKQLAAYEVTKGTIKFPLTEPVPTALVAGIARQRAKEVRAAIATAKKSAPKNAGAGRKPAKSVKSKPKSKAPSAKRRAKR